VFKEGRNKASQDIVHHHKERQDSVSQQSIVYDRKGCDVMTYLHMAAARKSM
jgi:hypothetical protein